MKRLYVLSVLLLSLRTFAQEDSQPERVKLKLGVIYSPDYSYRVLRNITSYESTQEQRNLDERPILTYTTGLSAVAYLNKNIGIETGICYTKKGEEGDVVRNIYDHLSPYRSYMYSYTHTYQYLEIPLKCTGIITRKRMSYFVNAGVGAEIMLKAEKELTYYVGTYSHTNKYVFGKESYEKVSFSAIVGLGISCAIGKKLAISFEPTYTQFLTPLYPGDFTTVYPPVYDFWDSVREFPFSIGIRGGIHYLIH